MQNFDVYLNILKTHLFSYIKQQRIINLFTKLKLKFRIVLTNYQNLSMIKKNLLSLIVKLKNNMRKQNINDTKNSKKK